MDGLLRDGYDHQRGEFEVPAAPAADSIRNFKFKAALESNSC
jgi:hypothetical protein